jgi:aminoglycoside phosphotransferase (APT) family kinase protein
VLKESRSTSVYRLHGAGRPGRSPVIAKHCAADVAAVECEVYESVLPRLPLRPLAYYESVAADDGRSHWLFTADAGDRKYSAARPAHRARAAEWLAQLHLSGQRLPAAALLPDRGPSYFLGHLHAAHSSLSRHCGNRALSGADAVVLRTLLSQCDRLESRWDEVERVCGRIPSTLNHGDFASRNIRLGVGRDGDDLRVFDWQDAGWGPPTLDLIQSSPRAVCDSASPDLAVYAALVRKEWPQVDAVLLRQLAALGRIFWYVVAMRLDADSLGSPWVQRPMRNMRSYRAGLAHALRAWSTEVR